MVTGAGSVGVVGAIVVTDAGTAREILRIPEMLAIRRMIIVTIGVRAGIHVLPVIQANVSLNAIEI